MVRLSREESRIRTRERLLASAARAFARAGYAGASVDDIAEDAGFSKGAFYSNFASKEAIFLTLLEDRKQSEIGTISGLMAEVDGDRLMETLTAWLDGLHGDRDLALLAAELELQARRSETLAADYEALQARFLNEIVSLVETVFDRLELVPPAAVEEIAATFIAISNGCALAASHRSDHQTGRAMRLFLDVLIKASRPRGV